MMMLVQTAFGGDRLYGQDESDRRAADAQPGRLRQHLPTSVLFGATVNVSLF
jgi:hypothetical protein